MKREWIEEGLEMYEGRELTLEEEFSKSLLEKELESLRLDSGLWYYYDNGRLVAAPFTEIKDSHLINIIYNCIKNRKKASFEKALNEFIRRHKLEAYHEEKLYYIYIYLREYHEKEGAEFGKVNDLQDKTCFVEFICRLYDANLDLDRIRIYFFALKGVFNLNY